MADGISVYASGSQVCVISTEHTLLEISSPGLFLADLDLSNLAASDTLEIRYYTPVASGGTKRQAALASFSNAQNSTTDALSAHKDVLKALGLQRLGTPYGFKLTIKQTAGTGRTIPWVVTQVSP